MKPVLFRYVNQTLTPPVETEYSENVDSVSSLPTWSDGAQCVSCWKMSLRERLSALLHGRVWLAVLSGGTQPPVYLQASKEYLKEV